MGELIDTTEMYLRTILELEEEGVPALRARIAERLGHSGPTVSQTVARMERDGLVHLTDARSLELTHAGRDTALRVMRKHRLAEVLLVQVIGVPLEQVHDEACRWEHVISDAVEERLDELLGRPSVSPFGNPIPARVGHVGALGAVGPGLMTAEDAAGAPGRYRVVRLTERAQSDAAVVAQLEGAGSGVGASVTVRRESGGNGVLMSGGRADVLLRPELAAAIVVRAEAPEQPAQT